MIEINRNAFVTRQGDFSPRTTEDERMAIIALHRAGVKPVILAHAFGANRRTIGKMVKEKDIYGNYAGLRRKADEYTQAELFEKYVTDEIVAKVNKATEFVTASQS